ncbi:MAG TPA: hypothetical protein VH640_27555 [Bryobacteraceae bacterium]
MKVRLMEALGIAACSLLLAVPMLAAAMPAKNSTAPSHTVQAVRSVWPPETLTGTILQVVPAERLVIVAGPAGVPFDMVVNRSTRIEAGNQRLTLDQVRSKLTDRVNVRFVPEGSGDIAQTIQIMG